MRGTVAKRLRKIVYGDRSKRNPYHYGKRGETIICIGKRGGYLEDKKAYKRGE